MKYNSRITKLEKKLFPQQKELIKISITSQFAIDFDQVREDYNKENGTNYTLSQWEKMDVIITRSSTEGNIDNWESETFITNGYTEEEINKKYPKSYQQYLVDVRRVDELLKSIYR